MADRGRFAYVALREALFLFLSLSGAVLFLNHQILYLSGDRPSSLPWPAYALSTILIYAFVRGIVLAGTMYVPPRVPDPTVCPECGRPFEDGTPVGARWLRAAPASPTETSQPHPVSATVPIARPIPTRTAAIQGEVINPRLDFLLMQGLSSRNPRAPVPINGNPRSGPENATKVP